MAGFLDNGITYRLGKHEDIQQLFEISYAEDWAVSYNLVESFFLSCPQAFFAADHGTKTIGYSMGDILSDDEGFVCIFIVDNAYQRRGIGKMLLTKCMEALGDINITLFATEKGAPYYKKHFGFKPIEQKARVVLQDKFQPNKMAFEDVTTTEARLVPLDEISPEKLEEYNTRLYTIKRKKHQEIVLKPEHAIATVTVDIGALVGYGCLFHLADTTYKIGPVLTENAHLAKVIMKGLLAKLPDECRVMMLCFEENPEAVEMMTKLGSKNAHREEVLYTKHQIDVSVKKVFCLDNVGNMFT